MTTTTAISGYTYGTKDVPKSPITMRDLELLKKTVLFTDDDTKHLNMAGEVLEDQIDDVLDLWYNFVGSNEHLVKYFSTDNGEPIGEYLDKVRGRFGQWIKDTCSAKYDQAWLDYMYEIGLRHHSTKKNKTDDVQSVPIIHYRYMIAFIYPITFTIRSFLEKKGHSPEEVDNMYQAWQKSVILQDIIWTFPYIKEGEF
jgi:hypothetical protein